MTTATTARPAFHGRTQSLPAARFEELDVLKGMLVVGMLVFHAASVAQERHPDHQISFLEQPLELYQALFLEVVAPGHP